MDFREIYEQLKTDPFFDEETRAELTALTDEKEIEDRFYRDLEFGTDEKLPVLVKFIDAKKDLSVQVHPDDEYAGIHEGQNGKTEMWYVVDADHRPIRFEKGETMFLLAGLGRCVLFGKAELLKIRC